jgi:hypothetical protein
MTAQYGDSVRGQIRSISLDTNRNLHRVHGYVMGARYIGHEADPGQ